MHKTKFDTINNISLEYLRSRENRTSEKIRNNGLALELIIKFIFTLQ